MTVSVLTLVRDRGAQLRNVVRGLARSEVRPRELVVAWMGGEDPAPALEGATCPVEIVEVAEAHRLPLAAARNAAAERARSDRLVLLDVDCIPGAGLVGAYDRALSQIDALLMGAVRYLPAGAADGSWDEAGLMAAGREHPARRAPGGIAGGPGGTVPAGDYAMFWSLSFAVRRATFLDRIGGFDTSFAGYGGEDTDLAFSARATGVPLAWVPGAVAFHQDHEHYDPPLHHLADIVANARRFRAKWGVWPMEGWLLAFAEAGWVRWGADDLSVLAEPTSSEREAARRRVFPG